jgi:Protein of unknown function (DUF998)
MTSSGVHGRGQLQPAPRALQRWLTVGTLWSVLFTAVYLVEGATRPGYDAWRQAISTLSLGPGGWIQQANFVTLGVVTLGLALAWRQDPQRWGVRDLVPDHARSRGPEPDRDRLLPHRSDAGLSAWFSSGRPVLHSPRDCTLRVSLCDHLCPDVRTVHHQRRFSGNPDWRGWVFYSVFSGVLINVLIALFGITNAHQFEYAGVFERVATNIEAMWGLAIVGRLWHGARLVNGRTGTREPAPSAGHRPTGA